MPKFVLPLCTVHTSDLLAEFFSTTKTRPSTFPIAGAYFIHDGKFPSRCKDHGPKKQQQKLKVRPFSPEALKGLQVCRVSASFKGQRRDLRCRLHEPHRPRRRETPGQSLLRPDHAHRVPPEDGRTEREAPLQVSGLRGEEDLPQGVGQVRDLRAGEGRGVGEHGRRKLLRVRGNG